MDEESKLFPESSREFQSIIFTQALQPLIDLIEDRQAQ